MRACGPSTPCITAPPPNNDVAPPSAVMMCADGWQRTAPQGGVAAESASEFAAVPLVTGKTRAVGCSKTVLTTSWRWAVRSSPPYASADPVFAACTASRISGATPAALSLRNSITAPLRPPGDPPPTAPRRTIGCDAVMRWSDPPARASMVRRREGWDVRLPLQGGLPPTEGLAGPVVEIACDESGFSGTNLLDASTP